MFRIMTPTTSNHGGQAGMKLPTILFAINSIVLGYILNLSGIVLNYLDGEKVGVALALTSFAAAYFSERDYVFGTRFPKVTAMLQIISITACAASLAVWFF